MDRAIQAAPGGLVVQAARSAMRSIDATTWRALTPPAPAAERITVTAAQWVTVLVDSELLVYVEGARDAMRGVREALDGGTRTVGHGLVPAAHRFIDALHGVRTAAADVLWFEPPDSQTASAVAALAGGVFSDAICLLESLSAGRGLTEPASAAPVAEAQALLTAALAANPGDDDRCARVYGVPAADLEVGALKVGSRLRAAFYGRGEELQQITMRLLGYACRGRPIVEALDGGLHPFALATDSHPLIAHRAARAVCDLVHLRVAHDLASVAAAIVDGVGRNQVAYSTHRGLSQTRRLIAAAPDADAQTRAVAELYRATSEGPLRMAAVTVLRLLGEETRTSAGLNEIRSRLLAHENETPLCRMMADLIVPSWRNPAAHEGLYWDPEAGTAMFGGHAVDLDQVHRTADRAWAAARGFQAGMALARGCLPELARAVDQRERPPAAIDKNIQLAKLFNTADLVVDQIERDAAQVVITLDTIRGRERLSRLAIALIQAAMIEPAIEQWRVELGGELPPFKIGAAAARVAATLYGPGPGGEHAFLYPVTFVPLLADALVRHGMSAADAAAHAWDLPLRDTSSFVGLLVRQRRLHRPSRLAELRRAARRTNNAVRTVARQLDLQPPAHLDLTALCTVIRRLEKRPHDDQLVAALAREGSRLTVALGPPPPRHPWAPLTDEARTPAVPA